LQAEAQASACKLPKKLFFSIKYIGVAFVPPCPTKLRL